LTSDCTAGTTPTAAGAGALFLVLLLVLLVLLVLVLLVLLLLLLLLRLLRVPPHVSRRIACDIAWYAFKCWPVVLYPAAAAHCCRESTSALLPPLVPSRCLLGSQAHALHRS
jgi:hypothetical protein